MTFTLEGESERLERFDMGQLEKKTKKNSNSPEQIYSSDYGNYIIYRGIPERGKAFFEPEKPRLTIKSDKRKTYTPIGMSKEISEQSIHEIIEVLSGYGRIFKNSKNGPFGPYRFYQLSRGSNLIYEIYFKRVTILTFDEKEYDTVRRELSIN